MLEIIVTLSEKYDSENNEFIVEEQKLQLEHSLVSLAEWESKWCKPFHSKLKEEKTPEETLDYIKCMTLTKDVDPVVYTKLSRQNVNQILDYISAPMTAMYIPKEKEGRGSIHGEQIIAELIYYWMFALNIPKECETWHLNRLIALIRMCSNKNNTNSKSPKGKKDLAKEYARLNAERRKKLNTKG